jgi:arylsulfatase A-like enzyme
LPLLNELKHRNVLCAGLLTLCLAACGLRAPQSPNLLLICIDTVRADLFYHPDIEDGLSLLLEEAQLWQEAVTVSPWTLPAIATVFTGLYPVQHGAGSFPGPMKNLAEESPTALALKADTLAEILAGEGYRTGVFSAHPWLKDSFGLDQGFEVREYYKGKDILIEKMQDFSNLSAAAREPFFAYLHLMESHDIQRQPEAILRARLEGLDAEQKAFLDANRMSSVCKANESKRCNRSLAYMASVLEARETLADIITALQDTGLLANTVVVLYSDHGEAFRERREQHQELQEDPRDTYGKGHGQYQFQELLHVPLLAWLPGIPGQVHSARVSLVDLYPSMLNWLGMEPPVGVELSGIRLGSTIVPNDPERVLYASNIAYGPETIAILSGNRKAMYWPELDRFLFFDLESDPDERNPQHDDAMLLEFSTLAGDYLDLPPLYESEASSPGQQQLEDLQAIGYLQGVEDDTEPDNGKNPSQDQD